MVQEYKPMKKLLELLASLDAVKRLAPYRWQCHDVLNLQAEVWDCANTVRADALHYAWNLLAEGR